MIGKPTRLRVSLRDSARRGERYFSGAVGFEYVLEPAAQ
jgi:hypothetical protein